MEFMTIKDLAKDQHVSYQAIRKLMLKYQAELEGHVLKKGGIMHLDEVAVNYLIEKRRNSPLVVVQDDQAGIIAGLERENEELKRKIMELQSDAVKREQEINRLQVGQQKALETQIRNEYLLADNDRMKEEAKEAKEELREIRQELNSFERTLFGFYRKKKT